MPRCEVCNRMQPSAEVRKQPSREAYRCKDKFGCELAETNRQPHTATIELTFPAKSMLEAWQILAGLGDIMRPYPSSIRKVTDGDRVTYSKQEAATQNDGPDALKELLSH